MAKSLVGMAFGFGAKDDGAEAAFDRTGENLEKLNNMLEDQSKVARKSFLPKFMQRLTQFNIGTMASNMQALTGDTNRLTNGIEAFGVQAEQAVRPVLARMGLIGEGARKATREISGLAYSLNTDAASVAESYSAIEDTSGATKEAIEAFDLTLKDHVKIMNVTGQSTEEFTSIIGDLAASWGLAPEQSKELIDSVVGIGQASGIGVQGLLKMKSSLAVMDQAFAASQLPRTPEMIQKINVSLVKLAGAFRKGVGDSAEDAMANAQAAFGAFAGELKTAEEMRKGLVDNYGEMTQKLAEVMGGYEGALEVITVGAQDPLKAMTILNEKFAEGAKSLDPFERARFGRLQSELAQIAPNVAFLTTNVDSGTKALEEMSNMAVKTSGSFKKLGEGYRAGITLAESLERAKESFETMVRSIARADVRKFVKNQRQAYKEVGREWKSMAKDQESIAGQALKWISAFDQLGIQGIFMQAAKAFGMKETKQAQKFGIQIGYMVDKANQLAGEFQPLVSMISTLGPLGTLGIAGGIAAWFTLDASDRKEVFGSWYPMIEGIMDTFEEYWDKIPWDSFKEKIVEYWDGFVEETVPKIGTFVKDAIGSAFDSIVGELSIGQIGIGAGILMGLKGMGFGGAFGGLLVAGGAYFIGWIDEKMEELSAEAKRIAEGAQKEMSEAAKVRTEIDVVGMKEREAVIKELTATELSVALAEDLVPAQIIDQFTRKEKLFADVLRYNAEVREKFAKSMELRKGIELEEADVENLIKRIEKIQILPEIQEKLASAMTGTSEEIATQFTIISEAYAEEDFLKTVESVRKFAEQKEKVELAFAAGVSVEVTPEEAFDVREKIETIYEDLYPEEYKVKEAGINTAVTYADGLVEGSEVVKGTMGQVLSDSVVKQIEGFSPPVEGPLSGTVLYDSGANILKTMIDGMYMHSDVFREEFAQILSGAVSTAVGQFQSGDISSEIYEKMYEAGRELNIQLSLGIDYEKETVFEEAEKVATGIRKFFPIAEEGPLVDLTKSGTDILTQILEGMYEYQPEFKEELATILSDAVLFAVNKFEDDVVREIDKKTTLIDDKLKALMETEVYKQFIADVSVEEKKTKKVAKEVAAIALSDSGLLGVKKAIVAQTAALVRVLNRIEDNTSILRKTSRGAVIQIAQPQ